MATYCPEAVMYDLCCPICFEDYDILSRQRAPKLLLCLHTFCYECTQRLWRADGTLECSLCRTLHTEVTLAELFDNPVILQHLRKQGEEQDMKLARKMDLEMRNGRCSPKTPDRGADVIDITSPVAARGEEWEDRRAEGPLFGGVMRPMPPLFPIAPPAPPRLLPHQEEEEEEEDEVEVGNFEPAFVFPDLDDDFQTILSDAESLVGEEEEVVVDDLDDTAEELDDTAEDLDDTAEELETTAEDVEDMTQDIEDTIEDIAENLEDVVENLEATVEDLEARAEDIMPWLGDDEDEEEDEEEEDDEEEEEEEEDDDRWHSASDDMTSSPWVEDFSMDDDIKPDSPDYLDWFVTW